MPRHLINILFLLTLFLLFSRCAQVVPLTGGERDAIPPKLMEALPENKKLNFKEDVIILKFDEFVQLKDLTNQLIVSPALKSDPEIESDGRKIKIRLKKEELRPNTTYRFFFGKAICDMNEANPLKNFEYVFSTGPLLDTLICKGKIETAFDKEEPGECIVGLYLKESIVSDSFPFKQKPDYISRSSTSGAFELKNLPAEQFKCIAFFDKNKNYMYDGESEKVAFKNAWFDPVTDTSVQLSLFTEKPVKNFYKRNISPYYGKILLIYNKAFKAEVRTFVPEDQQKIYHHQSLREKDTLMIFYAGIKDSLKLTVKRIDEGKVDTLNLTLPKFRAGKTKSFSYISNWTNGLIEKDKLPRMQFLQLVDMQKSSIEKMFIKYKKDSNYVKEPVKLTMIDPLTAELQNKLEEGIQYQLIADTAIFYDKLGRYNDSIKENIHLRKTSELGRLKLKLLLDRKENFLIQLLNEKNIVCAVTTVSLSLSSSNEVEIELKDLFPGSYKVKVIYDVNRNKEWDTGQLLLNKQPEKVFISSKQIKIMADWDVEEEVSIH